MFRSIREQRNPRDIIGVLNINAQEIESPGFICTPRSIIKNVTREQIEFAQRNYGNIYRYFDAIALTLLGNKALYTTTYKQLEQWKKDPKQQTAIDGSENSSMISQKNSNKTEERKTQEESMKPSESSTVSTPPSTSQLPTTTHPVVKKIVLRARLQ